MVDDILEVFAVNLQAIPNLGNIIEGGNALIFFMWITLTLPSYEIMLTEGQTLCEVCESTKVTGY